jgi:hypothetical protein
MLPLPEYATGGRLWVIISGGKKKKKKKTWPRPRRNPIVNGTLVCAPRGTAYDWNGTVSGAHAMLRDAYDCHLRARLIPVHARRGKTLIVIRRRRALAALITCMYGNGATDADRRCTRDLGRSRTEPSPDVHRPQRRFAVPSAATLAHGVRSRRLFPRGNPTAPGPSALARSLGSCDAPRTLSQKPLTVHRGRNRESGATRHRISLRAQSKRNNVQRSLRARGDGRHGRRRSEASAAGRWGGVEVCAGITAKVSKWLRHRAAGD